LPSLPRRRTCWAGEDHRRRAPPLEIIDKHNFSSLDDDQLRDTVKKFVDEIPELGGEVHWRGSGGYPRMRVRGSEGPKVIVSLPVSDNWYVTIGPVTALQRQTSCPRVAAAVAASRRERHLRGCFARVAVCSWL
jgi:hypothetical protein